MCGILGFAGSTRIASAELERALATLRHRGPDSQGVAVGKGWGLGACRLAIVDLVAGDQPVVNESGQVHAVFNGEIYNYRELAQVLKAHGHRLRSSGDTELLVHLWEEEGRNMLSRLRGMYAFAVVDERTQKLFLARDRLGKKPLYWMRTAGTLFFASELKALRCFAKSWPLDQEGLEAFLTFGFVPEGSTIVRGVEKLPPGHWLELDIPTGELHQGKLPPFVFAPQEGLSEAAAAQQLMELLAEATALRLRADVPVAVFLSGGMDSATVASLAARAGEAPRLLFVDLGDEGEKRRALATAAHLSLPLEVLPGVAAPQGELLSVLAEVFDEPLADPSVVPTYLLAQAAAGQVKVVLVGDGGDELLAGYRRFLLAEAASSPASRFLVGAGLAVAGRLGGARWWSRRFREGARATDGGYLAWGPVKFAPQEVAQLLGRKPQLTAYHEVLRAAPTDSPTNRLRALELFFFLPGDLLVKMDRANMASSLEARSPFLDQEVVRFALTLPPELLVRRWRTKWLLRRATRRLLPEAVRRGPKRGFEPNLASWLAGPWRGEVERLWRDPSCRIRALLRMGALERVLAELASTDPPRHARAVFTLLTLEHWLERWS